MALLDDLLASLGGGSQGPTDARPQASGEGGMQQILVALLPVVLAMLAPNRSGASRTPSGGGGGLGDLLGGLLGGAQGGGLGDLLGHLQRAGFGTQADSWVGRGQNAPLPPDALEQIFGRGGLTEIARQAGLSETDVSRGLSALLPEVVDRVTPEGRVPEADALSASVDALVRRLGVG